jgi:hypothetical protein
MRSQLTLPHIKVVGVIYTLDTFFSGQKIRIFKSTVLFDSKFNTDSKNDIKKNIKNIFRIFLYMGLIFGVPHL